MLFLIKKLEKISLNKLHALIVFLAFLFAAEIQYIQHGWINEDSLIYFEAARLIAEERWQEAMQVYPWPLYPSILAGICKVSGLEIHTSAKFLNSILFSLATSSFVTVIRLAGGKQLTMVAGALLLFSSQYIVGDVLAMLLRDEGFWAFYLTGLVFFIRFYQERRIKDAFFWQLFMIVATLFRIEAITYLIFLPALLISDLKTPFRLRLRHFLTCHSLTIFLAIGLVGAMGFHDELRMKDFGRLQEVFTTNIHEELTHQFFEKAKIMSGAVLGKYLEEFAVQGLLLTFAYVVIEKTISATGLFNVLLAGFNIKKNNSWMESKAYSALCFAVVISLINMAFIITRSFVLSGRYVIALSWILIIFAAFTFAQFMKKIINENENKASLKAGCYALIILMLLGSIKNIFPKSVGYNYMQDSVIWLKNYNKYNLPVFYGDPRLRYYAGEPFIGLYGKNEGLLSTLSKTKSTDQAEFLLISHSTKDPDRSRHLEESLTQYHEINRFNGVRNRKAIVIYKKYPD